MFKNVFVSCVGTASVLFLRCSAGATILSFALRAARAAAAVAAVRRPRDSTGNLSWPPDRGGGGDDPDYYD